MSLDLKTATESLLRTVCGSEFQTAGAEHRKVRFTNVVVLKCLKPRSRQIVPSHWRTQKKILKTRSVRVGYYTTLRYDVIHDILVLFSLHLLNATVEVI